MGKDYQRTFKIVLCLYLQGQKLRAIKHFKDNCAEHVSLRDAKGIVEVYCENANFMVIEEARETIQDAKAVLGINE
jgi:ribosomal protein L7/L12